MPPAPPAPRRPPHRLRSIGAGPRRDTRSRTVIGVGVSVLLHLLAILLYPTRTAELPHGVVVTTTPPNAIDEGMEVVRLAPFDDVPDRREPEDPLELVDPSLPDLPPAAALPEDIATTDVLLPASAAERLRPHLTVAELWAPFSGAVGALPIESQERIVLYSRIVEWYDSLAAAAAEEGALTDWTYTDEEGKRWGAADGLIYLGDFAVPLPFLFGVSNARREEIAERMWQWDELQRQGVRVELIESWEARQEAIRRRMDRERAAKADTGGIGGVRH